MEGSALGVSERRSVDTDGVTPMSQPGEQGIDEPLVSEEVTPFVVVKIRRNDRRPSSVAFFEELEEDVALFGPDVDISELINEQDVDTDELIEELSAGAVGERSVHFVEEILSSDEQTSVSVLERLHEQADSESGFSNACGPDEDDILGFGDEVELGEGAKLAPVHAGLFFERKRLEGPLFGKPCSFDSPLESCLLTMMPLGPQESNEEGLVGELVLVGVSEFLVEELGDALEMKVFEKLFELVTGHRVAQARRS